ncbi:acetyl-CoA carboxylase [Methylacidiphilum kamchatkense Kam1]|uniref:Biotin carboxylase n=1 Tax=Methylacidiphilum kamchatkense Kam1 TaxID=1202785 RepID=A0A0C1UTC3_9BACT|nr:acetyl-CoA carboxylase biotin carboxylase subunit [Methylacidiphilum kamchatkense]KIE59063.1 acetyl-CoA carboxylase [Methylacidiphilum kamchatkense Kam1]QDQ43030.1 acetyl-CoA carboxylase biotin carboxylase subunit [Methylacidiphilum kamchatkense Kam1]
MFNKILIANRGEIALRIIRACRDLGIKTLAVYSEADEKSLHVQQADEAICIGSGPSTESYLRMDRIISAAEIGDVDAIHPGYGFLAENPHFAEICANCNIKFIGPKATTLKKMGNKAMARFHARKVGVPVAPGSDGIVESEKEALKISHQIGYPVIIKAVAGGGGRGMRIAHNDVSLVQGFVAAKLEAEKSFGDGSLYIEKLIEDPRHVEFQILADTKGKIVHVGERDCSIQRRNQKLVEESPSPIMDPALRKRMGKTSIRLAESVDYEGVGTVEYLVDKAGNFYFIEMNCRIQVEHPVTEEVYGVDLVKEQILVAAGYSIGKEWEELEPKKHAIEFRVNSEDGLQDFRPSAGKIDFLHLPGGPGIRVDSHLYQGIEISPYYDSMLAKIIAIGNSRDEAIARMNRALNETIIEGVKTTIPIGKSVFQNTDFKRGDYTTNLINKILAAKKSLEEH